MHNTGASIIWTIWPQRQPDGSRSITVTQSLGVLLLSSVAAWAGGPIEIEGSWARATIGQVPNSAAYMEISNSGADADRLVAATTPNARKVELHEHVNQDGVMKMRPLEDGIEVPANGSVSLAPGGLHIMIMGLDEKLVAGKTIPITLTFERQGEMTLDVSIVEKKAASHGSHGEQTSHKAHGS